MGHKTEEFVGYGIPATPQKIAELTRAGVNIPAPERSAKKSEVRSALDQMQDIDGRLVQAAHDYSTKEGQDHWNEVIPQATSMLESAKETLNIAPVAWYGMTVNLVKVAMGVRDALNRHPDDEGLKVTLNLINLDIDQYLVCAMMEAVRAMKEKEGR